jgi:branched-chain amino acid transport system ATP-binding protein
MGLSHAMEGRRIFRQLTVEDNLRLAWQFGRRRNTWAVALDRVFQTFRILKEKRRTAAGLMSGGQQQMLIVSVATICNPDTLLLDEPSLGLAPIIVQESYAFFTERCREDGTTVLLAEQMAALTLKVSAHGYVLRQGRVVREGPSKELVDTGLVAALSSAYL